MQQYPTIMIGHAVNRPTFTRSCYQGMLQTLMNYPGQVSVRIAEGLLPAWARNYLIDEFLKDPKAEYLFFVDSDTGIPADGLAKLVAHQKDIVSGLYFGRVPPHNPVMKKRQKNDYGKEQYLPVLDYPEGLIEVDMLGAGCLLLSRKVLTSLKPPYFFSPSMDFSEDTYFCFAAKKAGFTLFVDTTVKCLHDTQISVDEATYTLRRLT